MTGRRRDAVVVGGGPAGLAFATAAARRGLDVLVLEARPFPVDKACGEGLLPAGVAALEALGLRDRLDASVATPIASLRWLEAGAGRRGRRPLMVEVPLPAPGGLGVRRTALSQLLVDAARAAGAEVVRAEVADHLRLADEVVVRHDGGEVRARLLVAADGLASRIRRREGLERPVGGPRRFGLRRHLPWAGQSEAVEVHLGDGVEAYLTPAGEGILGVAFLFEERATGGWPELLTRFPELSQRLGAAASGTAASADRGAGPLARGTTHRTLDRLTLLGDAAGYLDALSGEGLSLALGCALDLAALAPEAIARGASRRDLAGYERAWGRRYRPYLAWTRLLLSVSRRPWLRRGLLAAAARRPRPLAALVAAALSAPA